MDGKSPTKLAATPLADGSWQATRLMRLQHWRRLRRRRWHITKRSREQRHALALKHKREDATVQHRRLIHQACTESKLRSPVRVSNTAKQHRNTVRRTAASTEPLGRVVRAAVEAVSARHRPKQRSEIAKQMKALHDQRRVGPSGEDAAAWCGDSRPQWQKKRCGLLQERFEEMFQTQYSQIHRLETNK